MPWSACGASGTGGTTSHSRTRSSRPRCARCRPAALAAGTSYGPVAHLNRDRRDECGQPLAGRPHQLVHHARHVEHGGEGAVAADPAGQRLGSDHGRRSRRVPQQRDLADDQRRRQLQDGRHSVVPGVGDLRAARNRSARTTPPVLLGASRPGPPPRSAGAVAPPAEPELPDGSPRKPPGRRVRRR